MKDKISVQFVMEQRMCHNCKRNGSEYYELKLQVRLEGFKNDALMLKRKNICKYRRMDMKDYLSDDLKNYMLDNDKLKTYEMYMAEQNGENIEDLEDEDEDDLENIERLDVMDSNVISQTGLDNKVDLDSKVDLDNNSSSDKVSVYNADKSDAKKKKRRSAGFIKVDNLDCTKVSAEEMSALRVELNKYLTTEEIIEFNNNRIVMIKDSVRALVEKNFGKVNKLEELDNGFEFYFRNNGDRNKISNLFKRQFFTEEKLSKKIVGADSLATKDIWRYTQLIKIIDCDLGDKISVKGQEFWIKALNGRDLVLRQVIDGSKKVYSHRFRSDYFSVIEKCFNK